MILMTMTMNEGYDAKALGLGLGVVGGEDSTSTKTCSNKLLQSR
jgi:hypothetical protein